VARNTGLKKTTSNQIIFSEDDRIPNPKFVEIHHDHNLITSACELNLKWTGSGVMLLCILLISSAIIITSVMTICASFGFWVRDPSVIMDFMLKIKDYSKYPLSIYNPILRIVFTFVIPLGFMSY